MAKITFVDVTLRDGNHTFRHQFTPEIISSTAAALDAAGVDIIEVGHGDGLGGSCLHVGQSPVSDEALISAAVKAVRNARIGVILMPGFGTFAGLEKAAELGARVARVGSHCTEANVTGQHIRKARDLGLFTVGYLVSAGMTSPERLAEEAAKMESYGAECINLAESQGHLVPDEVAKRVEAVRAAVKIPIGFHPHNNLGLAMGNIACGGEQRRHLHRRQPARIRRRRGQRADRGGHRRAEARGSRGRRRPVQDPGRGADLREAGAPASDAHHRQRLDPDGLRERLRGLRAAGAPCRARSTDAIPASSCCGWANFASSMPRKTSSSRKRSASQAWPEPPAFATRTHPL